jgi:hypothetical protein
MLVFLLQNVFLVYVVKFENILLMNMVKLVEPTLLSISLVPRFYLIRIPTCKRCCILLFLLSISKKPTGRHECMIRCVYSEGFQFLEKMKGKTYTFLSHMEQDSKSAQSYNVTCYNSLKSQSAGQVKRWW